MTSSRDSPSSTTPDSVWPRRRAAAASSPSTGPTRMETCVSSVSDFRRPSFVLLILSQASRTLLCPYVRTKSGAGMLWLWNGLECSLLDVRVRSNRLTTE